MHIAVLEGILLLQDMVCMTAKKQHPSGNEQRCVCCTWAVYWTCHPAALHYVMLQLCQAHVYANAGCKM